MSWLNLQMTEGFCQGALSGHVYEIQKVTDVRRAASLKAGGSGIRYTCIVDGKESHLFYEDNNMWFMEERQFFNGVILVEKISKKVTG